MSRKLFGDSIILFFFSILCQIKGIILFPVYMRMSSLENYGQFIQLLALEAMIAPLITLSAGMGFFRFTSKEEEIAKSGQDYWSVFYVTCFLSFFVSILVLLFSNMLISYLFYDSGLLLVVSLIMLLFSNSIWTQTNKLLKSMKKFSGFVVVDFLFQLVPYVILVVCLSVKFPFDLQMFFYALAQLLVSLLGVFIVSCHYHVVIKKICLQRVTLFYRYSFSIFLYEISSIWLSKGYKIVVAVMLGSEFVGVLNIYERIASGFRVLTTPAYVQFNAYFSKMWDEGGGFNVISIVRSFFSIYIIISISSSFVILRYGEWILNMLMNSAHMISSTDFFVIFFASAINFSHHLLLPLARVQYKNMNAFYLNVVLLCVAIVGYVLTIPSLGIVGVLIVFPLRTVFHTAALIYILDMFNPKYLYRFFIFCTVTTLSSSLVYICIDSISVFSFMFFTISIFTIVLVLVLLEINYLKYKYRSLTCPPKT